MALSKIKIGSLIELYKSRCDIPNLLPENVSGVNKDKEFFEPSKQVANDTSNYKVVPPLFFACNLMHIGRDVVLPIAINRTKQNKYVSPAYTVFKLKNQNTILNEYLFILLNSAEKDRYFWFHCDSSVRDGMDWNSFCEMELEIPSIEIQRKYVAIYEGLLANLHSYERRIGDLKLVCDGYIEKLKNTAPLVSINQICEPFDIRNKVLQCVNIKGLTVYKKFIDTKANLNGVSLRNYKLVNPGDIVYVSTTNRNGDRLACAIADEICIVSVIYSTLKVNKDICNPAYLFMWFARSEMDRYARYNSWGSARENISWDDLGLYRIPLPVMPVQNAIVDILSRYNGSEKTIENLKAIIATICPVLIRGSIEESNGGSF